MTQPIPTAADDLATLGKQVKLFGTAEVQAYERLAAFISAHPDKPETQVQPDSASTDIEAREALDQIELAAKMTYQKGATNGPHWIKLSGALSRFGIVRAALDHLQSIQAENEALRVERDAALDIVSHYRAAIYELSRTMPGTKLTYFEAPLRDMDAITRWQMLDAVGKRAAAILGSSVNG